MLQFELVCGRTALAGLTQTLLALGAGLGSIFWPWLSDIFGRKRIIVVSLTLMFATTLVAGFAPNYSVFAVTKFFVGFLETVRPSWVFVSCSDSFYWVFVSCSDSFYCSFVLCLFFSF